MPDHRIRLRGAWDRLEPSDPAATTRVDLPTVWTVADDTGPVRLSRRFGRPRFDSTTEAVELELVDVPGLRAVRLNGRTLGEGRLAADSPRRFPVGAALLARNVLELDVVLDGSTPLGTAWGTIALVIVRRPG